MFQFDHDGEIERHIAVRDYLRVHPEQAEKYGCLKARLAKQFPYDIEAYMDGKDKFVKQLEQDALLWKAND
nr:GrpB family protein [Bacillus sp. WMMC1349]